MNTFERKKLGITLKDIARIITAIIICLIIHNIYLLCHLSLMDSMDEN